MSYKAKLNRATFKAPKIRFYGSLNTITAKAVRNNKQDGKATYKIGA